MSFELSEDYMEKLEQLVFDESRLVTCKILSAELKIHINKAKLCMMSFARAQNMKTDACLRVCYFLAGFMEKDGVKCMKVQVVSQDALEKTKRNFKELTSCHIYSVNKGRNVDECALYAAEHIYFREASEQSKYSAIKHFNIEIQPPLLNKITTQKNDARLTVNKIPDKAIQKNGSLPFSSLKKESENNEREKNSSICIKDKIEKSSEMDPQKKQSSPEKNPKKNTLASLWQNAEKCNVAKDIPKLEGTGKQKSPQGTVKNLPKNNIMNLFSRQAVKNAESVNKTSVAELETCIKVENATPEKEAKYNNELSKSIPKVNKSTAKKEVKKRKPSQRQSSKMSKQKDSSDSESEVRPKKKHRRICTFEESDSESECEEARDKIQRNLCAAEEPINTVVPSSEDEDPIPPTPCVVSHKIKGKMWKTVKKTYQDEDGFFVTKAEKQLVSASESDEDPLSQKEERKKVTEEIKQNFFTNRKQASLTSFFKQK